MAEFTESMKAFTDRLRSSIDDRGESLARVHRATTDLLDGARDFLEGVSLEHDARAEQVHAFMADSRAHRRETVKAMADSHRENLAAMSDEMHRTLDEATKGRIEEVNTFMADSRSHRLETFQAMRDGHREGLAAMGEELRHTLDEANKGRLEAVGLMRETFQVARHELASDLRDASRAWRDFAGRRDVAPMPEPTPEAHDEGKKPRQAAQQGAKKKKASRAR